MAKRKQPEKWTAIYTRVSSTGQQDKAQVHELKRYVEAHGLTRVKWYRDKTTGKNLQRPAMKRLQADIFSGKVSAVICWKLDRLARNMKDGINLLADWCEKSIRVVSVTQQLDLSGTVGKLIAAVLLAVAEMELENINERIRSGIAARKAKGLPMGRRKGQNIKWGLSKRKIDPELVKSLKEQGEKVKDIAAKFGVTKQAVYGVLRAG